MTGTKKWDGYNLAGTDFLTDSLVRTAKPKARPYKLKDGGGLYLLVTPADTRQWRLRYTFGGQESMIALGTYPATSLKAARAEARGDANGDRGGKKSCGREEGAPRKQCQHL